MALDRAAVYNALAAKLFAIPGLRGKYRSDPTLDQWQRPGICVLEGDQNPQNQAMHRPLWTLDAVLTIAVDRPRDVTTASELQTWIRAIEEALAKVKPETAASGTPPWPINGDEWSTSLGGLVGEITFGPITVGLGTENQDVEVAVMQISMLCAS